MNNFIFTDSSEKLDNFYLKIKDIIKSEMQKDGDICEPYKKTIDLLYNVEKTSKYTNEIDSDSNSSVEYTFSRGFTITKKMIDDAREGISVAIKRIPRRLVRSYYRTKSKMAELALANGTAKSFEFNGVNVDITCKDKLPLFSKEHAFHNQEYSIEKQSNYYYGDVSSSAGKLYQALDTLSDIMLNYKNENGQPNGYVADTIVLPGNRYGLEILVKNMVGSQLHCTMYAEQKKDKYKHWTVCVLAHWEAEDDRFMVLSSTANRELRGNMFYDGTPLCVNNWLEMPINNYEWWGRCSFSVGFNNWQHIILCVDSASRVSEATALDDIARI